jgi:DNA-binding beta-propeller fold protein YncE
VTPAARAALLLAAGLALPGAAQEGGRDTLAHERAAQSVTDLNPELVIWGGYYSGSFGGVAGVHCDRRTGEILVADPVANSIEIFDERGAPLFAFTDAAHLHGPTRVAVDARGRIHVLDGDRDRIKVFSYRGDFEGELELTGLDVPGGPGGPVFTAIAFDANGDLYVGESRSGQVVAFGRTLKPKLRIGTLGEGPGQLNGIVGIAFDAKSVYVASQDGVAVHVFTRQGKLLRSWGFHDVGLHNVSLPAGIAVDAQGRVILLDTLRQEVKYFDSDGKLIGNFAGLGRQPGAVAYPTDLSLDRKGRLCVADGGNKRAQVLVPVEPPEPPPER